MGIVNRIGEAEQERVGLFSEEMGEAQVEIGKILRHGIDSHHPDDPDLSNAQRLELEAGHVLAAIDLLVACGTLSHEGLARYRRAKLEKLRSWLHCGTNLDAVEELLAEGRVAVVGLMGMIADAREEYRRLSEPMLHGESDEVLAFSKKLEAAIGECSVEQAIDGLRRFMVERRDAAEAARKRNVQEANEHQCDGTNIAQAADGTFYCAHCGWNEPKTEAPYFSNLGRDGR